MASIYSTLSLVDQATRLREFVAARGITLSETAAQNVCNAIDLSRPGESKFVAKRLVAALAAHGVIIKHTNALEALAKLCGEQNWMRTRQAELQFDGAKSDYVAYVLEVVRDSEVRLAIEMFPTISEATDRLLNLLSTEWPAEVAASLCTVSIAAQMLMLELEHPTAPWMQVKVCRLIGTQESPDLGDLPHDEARAFCARMTRALEYTYPGLLVVNSLRSTTLSPSYRLCPHLHQLNNGYKGTCWSDLELLPTLDGLGAKPTARYAEGVFKVETDEGLVELAPAWMSNGDGSSLIGGLTTDQLNGLIKRLMRLRRLTGGSIARLVSLAATGPDGADNCFLVDKESLETAFRQLNLTPKQLALRADVPLNVVQRILKYGYAHETVIPKLSSALGLRHPNELLPPEKSHGTGIRIVDGTTFLRGLKQTHMWRRIVSDSLQGDEADEVNRIAEALQDYVEVLQFRTGPFSAHVDGLATLEKPVDETALARAVQDLLDELSDMGIAVVVSNDIRFAHDSEYLQGMEGLPLHHGTLFFERESMLKRPRMQSSTMA